VLSLYYKRSFDEDSSVCLASGRVGAAAGQDVGSGCGQKITPISTDRGNCQEWLPYSGSPQTVDIILPNTIHGCKKKDI